MTRIEGEHELILGNKQLLSAFFVVVILLGVFFTMGYFVGRNSASSGYNAGQIASSGGTRPDAAGKPLDTASNAAPAPPPESTSPARDANEGTPAAENATPVAAAPSKSSEAEPPAVRSSASEEAMAKPSAEQMYLQLSALRRADADNSVKVLRERGFPALLGESSQPGLYRVLVGPFKTRGEMGRAKADLKAKGFDSIVAK